jgi:hypothetical protein
MNSGTAMTTSTSVEGSSPSSSGGQIDLATIKQSAAERLTSERDKLTEQAKSFTSELRSMQGSQGEPGLASNLVGQVAQRADEAIAYVESRDPEELLTEARRYAQNHPGLFLAGTALVGLMLGRVTRTAVSAASDSMGSDVSSSSGEISGGKPRVVDVR